MASSAAATRSSAVSVALLLAAAFALSATPVDGAACGNPCWTSDIRNQPMVAYHLNLEYLLAEAYSCWAYGTGIPASLRGGGPPSIGCQKLNFQDPFVKSVAESFAQDNINHVTTLRASIAGSANPIPLLNVGINSAPNASVPAFINLALQAAGLGSKVAKASKPVSVPQTPGLTCNMTCSNYCKKAPLSAPKSSDDQMFLLAAFIFEDVMVTAYEGDIGQLADSLAGLGLQAAASYHAGSIRQQLIQQAFTTVDSFGGLPMYQVTQAISDMRARLSSMYYPNDRLQNDDQNIVQADGKSPTLVPSNGYTFDRIPSQTTSIFTGGVGNKAGLFFPQGFSSVPKGSPIVPGNYPVTGQVTTKDTFTFALNLEYLEAELYTWAIYGHGNTKCNGACGPTYGGKKANLSTPIYNLIAEVREHEYDHLSFMSSKVNSLGGPVPPKPALNLTVFADIANAAFGTVFSPPFDPFKDDISFLIATYIMEDVGVSGYLNAVAHIQDRTYLRGGGGITALEAYHAGAVRTLLAQQANLIVQPFGVSVASICQAISSLRSAVSHVNDDTGILDGAGVPTILNAGSTGIVRDRSPAQIVAITTLAKTGGAGGFFPTGYHGTINGTRGSPGSAQYLPL